MKSQFIGAVASDQWRCRKDNQRCKTQHAARVGWFALAKEDDGGVWSGVESMGVILVLVFQLCFCFLQCVVARSVGYHKDDPRCFEKQIYIYIVQNKVFMLV